MIEYIVFIKQTQEEIIPGKDNKFRTREFVNRYFPKDMDDLKECIKNELERIRFQGYGSHTRVEAEVTGVYEGQEYKKIPFKVEE